MLQTRILLVRHGETEWNIAGRLQGWQDSPLSARGLAQVHRLAEALIGCAAVALVASDAGRAVATAGVIGDRIGLATRLDARLREISFGSVEGLTRAALPPEIETARAQIMAMDPSCNVALAGGESPATVSARVWSCLDELASRHAGSTVVVVSHGGVLASVLRTVLGIPAGAPRRFRIGNTAVVQVVRRHEAEPWAIEFDDLDPVSPASSPA